MKIFSALLIAGMMSIGLSVLAEDLVEYPGQTPEAADTATTASGCWEGCPECCKNIGVGDANAVRTAECLVAGKGFCTDNGQGSGSKSTH